jgi:hypothetical protein
MWFILLLTLVNAATNQVTVGLRYRIEIGGMPIGIYEGLLLVGVIVGLWSHRHATPTDGVHPLLTWLLVLFGAATVAGIMGTLIANAELRWMLTGMRNWVSLPTCILIGYCLLLHPRSCLRFSYVHVIGGIAAASVVLWHFTRSASLYGSDSLARLRTIVYVTNYAGIAGALLLFTIISRIRILPTWLAIVISGFCVVGQFGTLTRSDWVATMAGVLAIYVLLPSFRPHGKLMTALVVPPLVVLFLWGGLMFASAVAGRSFEQKMAQRFESLLPGKSTSGVRDKAWDSRLYGIRRELEIWRRSPIIGGGFGATDILTYRLGDVGGISSSFRHNAWTSTLAESGTIGFAAIACMVFGTIVVGRRLAKDGVDRGYVLMGALAVIAGSYYLVLGMSTQSFNQMRWGIPIGIICGATLRARAMQLSHLRALHMAAAETSMPEDEDGHDYDYGGQPAPVPAPAGAYAADSYY